MKFSTMIPLNYNNGQDISTVTLECIYRRFWEEYGGCTVDAPADGYWLDPATEKLFHDRVRRLTVIVSDDDPGDIDKARRIVEKIGQGLGQLSMYFEHDVTGKTVVEFVDCKRE